MVLTRNPYPATDGTRFKILHNIIYPLSQVCDIDFLLVTNESYTESELHVLKKIGNVYCVRFSKIQFIRHALYYGLFRGKPLQVGAFYSKAIQAHLNNTIAQYDGYYFHTIRTFEYCMNSTVDIHSKSIFDYNDAISFHYKQALPFVGFLKKMFYYIEGLLVSRYEQKVLSRCVYGVVVSQRDARALDPKNMSQCLSVIPYGTVVPQNTHSENYTNPVSPKIFFMGNLDYEPNRDGLVFFIQKVFPALRRVIPNIELCVAGKGSPPIQAQGVKYLGFVESLLYEMSQCFCTVSPIRFGAGVPTKILDAMTLGCPVVASHFSVSGLVDFQHGIHGIVIDEFNGVDAWVREIVRIYADHALRDMLTRAGFEYIANYHNLKRVQKQWVDSISVVFDV